MKTEITNLSDSLASDRKENLRKAIRYLGEAVVIVVSEVGASRMPESVKYARALISINDAYQHMCETSAMIDKRESDFHGADL